MSYEYSHDSENLSIPSEVKSLYDIIENVFSDELKCKYRKELLQILIDSLPLDEKNMYSDIHSKSWVVVNRS